MVNVLSNINKPFEYKGVKVNVIYREDGKILTKASDVCEILGNSKEAGLKAVQRQVPKKHKLAYSEINPLKKVSTILKACFKPMLVCID